MGIHVCRAKTQGAWAVLPFALALCTALDATGCKKSTYETIDSDGSSGVKTDGGKRDASTSDVPGTQNHANTCSPDTPSKSKGRAESCSCDRECQTGFCVDGVCCTSACGENCKACNLPSSLGECAFIPAGVKPADPLVCAATTPATCGQDGTCDGRGGCRLYVKGTECKPGTCDGDAVTGTLTCDGNGECSKAISQTCPPYSCLPATNRCATTCTTDVECAAGQQCLAERCGKSANGAVCQTSDDCSSGFCVDGVCCNIACSGTCVSCNQTGSVGHCTYVAVGLPDPKCQATDRTTCGNTGLCDGLGTCALYPENTVCGPSSCSGVVENTPRTCDGQGTCRTSQLVDCAPFLCGNGACETSCDPNLTDSCEAGLQCVSQIKNGVTTGICGKRKNGQPCPDGSECESGQCEDGVCCESSCSGACRSCNLPGSPGRCLNVASGGTDPRGLCVDLGAASCSTNGVCDGQGSCKTYPAGTECDGQRCVAGAYTPPSTCNAAGQCVASRSRTCSPFLCNGDSCFSSCTNSNQCVTGRFCTGSSCGLKPGGADCGVGQECQSGFCAQGVCCDSACTDACRACNLTATAGLCTVVADNAPDPQGKCAVSQPNTCGTTGSCVKGACADYDKGLKCKPAVCASTAALTPTSICDGKGACTTPANQSCGAFVCAADACKSSCTPATEAQDCIPPDTCVGGSCGLKANGSACTSARQCQSGFCTEGLCCDTACADAASGGLCKTCGGTSTASAGTCSNVDVGDPDPHSRCAKSDAKTGDCSNDGTCNGLGACRPWSSTMGCRQEACTGSTHVLPATCDGNGACPAANTASCGSYVCNSTSPTCLNTCSSDSDCTNSLTCLKTTNSCGDKLAAGEACKANSDCGTGLLCSAEGVCCDKACAGGCQSCKLAGKTGVCSNVAAASTPRTTTPATCPAAATGACGNSGSCDGSGGCELRSSCAVNNTICPQDTHFRYNASGSCGATGTCSPMTAACGAGYLCVSGGSCATSCTTANAGTNCDVASGYSCIGGFCQKRSNGLACTAGNQCSIGNCVDGYCCSAASCTDCQSCNVAGHEGTCWNVPASTADGACVGSCPSTTHASGLCNGLGACNGTSFCGAGYICVAGICGTSCRGSGDCAAGYSCAAGGTCKKSTGQICASSTDCASGSCVDGYCCASSSCADCMSCNVAGHEGSCYQVAAGTADGACVASCVGNQLGGLCDGSGSCRPPAACANGYLCGSNAECATSCTTTCAPGYYCAGNACVAQKANGQGCGGGGECASGQCVDGTCCAASSCQDCMSCNVAGHEGACYQVPAGTADGTCVSVCPIGGNQVAGLCDGNGSCRTASACPDGNMCGGNGQCSNDCTATECASGFFCSGTSCVAMKNDGAPCSLDGECIHGNCISGGSGSICCSVACADVTCGTMALCNANGSGCQTHGEGSACSAGSATCASDGRSSLAATGTCSSGVCQPDATPCTTGYLCVGSACVAPGSCTAVSDCDAANSYTCNTTNGNCEPVPPSP
jgi:hypothetical protein